ncbi:FGGY-family carbohydrate kinase [Neobacillus soli]|uniref:FGGY-family carbohydrate kinase n=1 Tax=Neobacillus soli TaxID=220688 RepID=UPI000824C998|nr:FGGY family carbohydrate kinase [Neobacillus soli]
MPLQKGYLVFDVGTGNARVAIVGTNGQVLAIEREDITYEVESLYPDSHYFSPQKLWVQLLRISKKVLNKTDDVELLAITSTSQRQGIVLFDKNGDSLIGLPNLDNRGREWEQEISHPETIYQKTGRLPNALFSGLKLFAVKNKQPLLWEKVAAFTSISDWITYQLTGKMVYEPSQAAETLLYDVHKNEWSEELCQQFRISPQLLPTITWSGTVLGFPSDLMANDLQLSTELPVIVGGADTQVAVKGTRASVDDLVIVSGTTTPIVQVVNETVQDSVEYKTWLNSHIENGRWTVETNPGITGLNYQRLKTIFYPNESYDVMEKEIAQAGEAVIVASLGSYMTHEKNGLVKGGFIFNAPVPPELSRAHFIWSALREIAFTIKWHFDALANITRTKREYVWACGGGFQSPSFAQFLADLLQKDIRISEGFMHASIAGAAAICNEALEINIGQSVSAAIIKPSKETNAAALYEEWKEAQQFYANITHSYKNKKEPLLNHS